MPYFVSRIFLQQFSRQYQINCGSFDFSSPTSWAFDLEIGPYSGEFDQAFLKKSNAPGVCLGGGAGMIAFGIDPDITPAHANIAICIILWASIKYP